MTKRCADIDDYVAIARHVRPLGDEQDLQRGLDATARRLFGALSNDNAPTLASLLDADAAEPLVLIAPSGTGKTTEFRQQARRLRSAGHGAVFAEALAIVAGAELDLDPEEEVALRDLLQKRQRGVLFLDAVDELRLRQCTLEQLIRRLRREIDFVEHPLRLVFSARNGAWTASATKELRRQLERIGAPAPKLVRFERLDSEAIATLVAAFGVDDVRAFMAEFEAEELDDLFDLRPSDVKLLVSLRKRSGSLADWTRVMADYVDASFIEERADRNWQATLSLQQARRGLERVAAAALLTQLPHVSTPTVAPAGDAVSSRRLFADWSAGGVAELFENPLFAHKGLHAEAVQLPQGRISQFLAARWFAERVQHGLAAEELRGALMVTLPWGDRFEIPRAHQRVIGWVSSVLPTFRKLLVAEHPAAVLYEGDPERLSDPEIREGLRHLCEAVATKRWDGWATAATVRRLARSTLEGDVKALFREYEAAPGVLLQLLKWVELGRYRACTDVALELAGTSGDSLVRTLAVGAFAAASADRAKLGALTNDTDDYVRRALLLALVPDLLNGEALVAFILLGGGHAVRHGLAEVGNRISTMDLDSAIARLLPVLASSSVTKDTTTAFELAVPLLVARLERSTPVPPPAVEALITIERLRHDHTHINFYDSEERALVRLLHGKDDLRRALWRLRFREVEASANAYHHTEHPSFGELQPSDLHWLWELTEEQRGRSQRRARTALDGLWRRLTAQERVTVTTGSLPDALRNYLDGLVKWEAECQERESSRKAAEERQRHEQRRENELALFSKRAAIESGDDMRALHWAWAHLAGNGSDRSRLSPERLRLFVGEEYVQLFLRGFSACWRKTQVSVHAPEGGSTGDDLLSLTGLAVATRAGLDVSTLPEHDAQRAARLGLHELNSLPFWYGDLARAHPEAVRRALVEVVALEWPFAKEYHGVLRFASYAEREVAEAMRDVVLEFLAEGAPAHSRTLHYAVNAVLTSTLQTPRVLAFVRRELDRSGGATPEPDWLRLWAHLDPEAAANWFSNRSSTDRAATLPTLLATAALLERDLDEHHGPPVTTALMAPRALRCWAHLLLSLVRPGDDVEHQGVYHPADRDFAQDLRQRCLSRIASNPAPEARAVLLELRADPALVTEWERLDWLLAEQHAVAIEAAPVKWTEEDVLRMEHADEKLPRSPSELFQLVQAHLRHVHLLIANDDFSYRDLFAAEGVQEREIQLWVASCLRERARGLYSVVRENVVDDDKEVDISAFAPGVGHVPIEIKPLGKYSVAALEKVLVDQLLGQYMQPPDQRYGVLLLVRRDKKSWRIGKSPTGLDGIVSHLRASAAEVGAKHGKEIHVAVIDLLAVPTAVRERAAADVAKASASARPAPRPTSKASRRVRKSFSGRGKRR